MRHGSSSGRSSFITRCCEAREALERALALDPGHPRAPGALSWLDGHDGHYAQAAARMQHLLEMDQGEANPLLQTALAFWRGDTRAQEEALARLRTIKDSREIAFVPDFVGQRAGHLEGAVRVARLLVEPTRSLAMQARGYRTIANLELVRGRPRAASAALAQLERLMPSHGKQVGTLILLNPFFPMPTKQADTLRVALAAWVPQHQHDSTRRLYLLGLLAARVRDTAAALRYANELESGAAPPGTQRPLRVRRTMHDMALTVRADLAWRAGQASLALELLERRHPDLWYPPEMDLTDSEELELEYPFLNQAYERWMRAELLAQLNRRPEALNWYAGLGLYPDEEMAYLAPARLRAGFTHWLRPPDPAASASARISLPARRS